MVFSHSDGQGLFHGWYSLLILPRTADK